MSTFSWNLWVGWRTWFIWHGIDGKIRRSPQQNPADEKDSRPESNAKRKLKSRLSNRLFSFKCSDQCFAFRCRVATNLPWHLPPHPQFPKFPRLKVKDQFHRKLSIQLVHLLWLINPEKQFKNSCKEKIWFGVLFWFEIVWCSRSGNAQGTCD